MGDLVTLLKFLIDNVPLWVAAVFALPAIVWCLFKGFWEIKKLIAETKLAEAKAKAEIAALREKEPPPSEVSDFPEFKPVSGKTWFLSITLAIGNVVGIVLLSVSGKLTILEVASIALSFFAAAWCLATPVFTTLLRNMAHTLKVHLWLVRFSFKEQFALMRSSFQEQADFSKKMLSTGGELFQTISSADKELFQTWLRGDRELFAHIGKEIEEIKSLLQSRR